MANWERFDQTVNVSELNKQIEEAKSNDRGPSGELPAGTYVAEIENLTLGETKDGRPMLRTMLRVREGRFTNWCIFFNKVIYGTKNDGAMIHACNQFLRSIEPYEDLDIKFESYTQYANLINDVKADTMGVRYTVAYDDSQFNSVVVLDMTEQ